MSFILDALRKAERDKNRGTTPSLEDVVHMPPRPLEPVRSSRPWVIVVGVLSLVIFLLLWKQFERSPAGSAPRAGVVDADADGDGEVDMAEMPAVLGHDEHHADQDSAGLSGRSGGERGQAWQGDAVALESGAPAQSAQGEPPADDRDDPDAAMFRTHPERVEYVDDRELAQRAGRTEHAIPARVVEEPEAQDHELIQADSFDDLLGDSDSATVKRAAARKAEEQSAPAQKPAVKKPAPKTPSAKAPAPVAAAQPADEPGSASEQRAVETPTVPPGEASPMSASTPISESDLSSDPPDLRAMPDAYRSAFRDLNLDVHVHDAEPDRRWIMINGKKSVEGATLSQGPTVEEITEDGVIYRFRGELVKVPLNR